MVQNLGRGWNINANLELTLGAARGSVLLLPRQGANHVLRDQSPLLGVGEKGAEVANHPLDHGRRTVMRPQLILEGPHQWDGEVGKLHRPDERDDVRGEMLAVGFDGGALETGIGIGQPLRAGASDGEARGAVDALGDVTLDGDLVGLSIALTLEGLMTALPGLIDVVNDPGLSRLTCLRREPTTLAN